ncbi:MAG: TonB family protein [Polyangiaceae bacterium]
MLKNSTRPARLSNVLASVGVLVSFFGHGMALAQEVVPPKPIERVTPVWPKGSSRAHDVVVPVVLTIAADGRVEDVQLEASIDSEFDRLAIDAAKRWTFEPALYRGTAVPAKVRAILRFLGDPSRSSSVPPVEGSESSDASHAEETHQTEPTRALPEPSASGRSNVSHSVAGPRSEPIDVEVVGEKSAPPRSASETSRSQDVIQAAPHRTGGDLLQIVPGVFITQHSGQGKAYQVFYRGFDAIHGQDLEFWVGGAPVNEVSNIHGQGYADLHFVMPEVVSRIAVFPGNYSPFQGDFAVAGTIRYDLGYREPGVTAKGTLGSFGERRVFLAYHPRDASPGSFAAFEAQSTDGFGPGRAASRTSAIAQHEYRLGRDRFRLLATGYAGRFDSPGVVRLADIETRKLDRFETYGIEQGGYSSRYQFVGEYTGNSGDSHWALAPYVVLRSLKLKQNYTGYLLDESNGDTTQLLNEATTLGMTARFHKDVRWLSSRDAVEAGISVRNDWVSQSQLDVAAGNSRVIGTIVDAKIRAMDAAGWVDLAVSPFPRVKIRSGLRVDGLAYQVQDDTPASETRPGADRKCPRASAEARQSRWTGENGHGNSLRTAAHARRRTRAGTTRHSLLR